MKYKYVAVNRRMIPENQAELVMSRMLGSCFIFKEVITESGSDAKRDITRLFKAAEEAGIGKSFKKVELTEMFEKFTAVNNPVSYPVHIVISEGEKDLFFIGFSGGFFH